MRTSYLVCYDIANPRRLSRVYRFVKRQGIHLQYSVFHCRLTWPELKELEAGLREIIDEKRDDVRIYPLPGEPNVTVMGQGDRVPGGVEVFLS